MTRTDHWDGRDPADRLDGDLDRIVRGGRPDSGAERSGFGPTIEHLYQLASDARVTVQPSVRQRSPTPNHAPFSTIPRISRRTIMSGLSTAAVLALMLTIAFNAFPLAGSINLPETRLAAINQGSPAAQPDDCTFPASDQFATGNPAVPERSPGMQPRSIVFRNTLNPRPIETEVLEIADGQMENPTDPLHVGWYEQTAAPGEPGNMLMSGFVDSRDSGPAALAQLGTVAAGDEVQIDTASGISYVYVVEWTETYELSGLTDDIVAKVLGPTMEPSLTMITCGGEFDYDTGQYLSRTVARATLQTRYSEATPEAVRPVENLKVEPPRPLTPEDCSVEPRSHDEIIAILAAFPSTSVPPAPSMTLTQETFDQLQLVLRRFQACKVFGMTYEMAALLSENAIRDRVYSPAHLAPYSEATLNEIVQGWVESDAGSARSQARSPALSRDTPVLVLSPDPQLRGFAFLVTTGMITVPVMKQTPSGQEYSSAPDVPTVTFVLERGRWVIASYPAIAEG